MVPALNTGFGDLSNPGNVDMLGVGKFISWNGVTAPLIGWTQGGDETDYIHSLTTARLGFIRDL